MSDSGEFINLLRYTKCEDTRDLSVRIVRCGNNLYKLSTHAIE